ncbi:hypothetical protein ElyMa_000747100 [Elysia marginata]|uniref:Uncharacterized protein n=1 Tax=Elysia marginata TaxID=1093978 RepID=A0AAV4GPX5_9GAST|nr:hypothetical protein ElyMa_000747100 [Elysia marginata]
MNFWDGVAEIYCYDINRERREGRQAEITKDEPSFYGFKAGTMTVSFLLTVNEVKTLEFELLFSAQGDTLTVTSSEQSETIQRLLERIAIARIY